MIANLLALAVVSAAAPHLPVEKYQLGNGLTVLLSEDHRLPVVAVDVWYHVGAANESPGKSGFAHLFEHLMFQGSKHLEGDERAFFSTLEKAGASYVNGSTENDRTNYLETLPADRLALALWLESDRMGFLLDRTDQKRLDTQRDVVRNEKRQSIDNAPYQRAEVRLVELLFPKPHPYFGAVIGSHEDLQAASLDDVKTFFRTYYAPGNASLAIVGDFDSAEAKALMEKYFAGIPRGPEKPPLRVKTEPLTEEKRESLTDTVQLSRVMIGYLGPRWYADDEPALQVGLAVLSLGKASRLYHDLVYQKKIAQEASAQLTSAVLGGVAELSGLVQAGHTPAEVEAALDEQIKRLRESPVSAAELARVKRAVEESAYRRLENVGGPGGKADLLNEFEMLKGNPDYLGQRLATLRAVTPEAVQAAARKYLVDGQRVVITVTPEAPAPAGGK